MRKLFVFLLISFIAIQTSWAAVAGYCQHEQGAVTRHLGHHEHQHHQPSATQERAQNSNAGIDLDCNVCYAGCLLALLIEPGISAMAITITALAEPPSGHPPPSPPPDLPERPNWS